MLFRQYCLLLLATTLIVALTEEASTAFTITPRQPGARFNYRFSERYSLGSNRRGITVLTGYPRFDPRSIFFAGQVTEITRGGTSGLLNALSPFTAKGWTFNQAENDLLGEFDIEYYYACAITTQCGRGIGDPVQYGVGSAFQLKYNPGENDPTGNNLHWIQRVIANYDPDTKTDLIPIDKIDIPFGAIETPYYDDYYLLNPNTFTDRPYNGNPENNHYFFAELYLVEETAPQTVTIYNGVKWGWRNQVSPPPCLRNTTSNNISNDAIIGASYGGLPDWDKLGATQENPLIASKNEELWQIFENVSSCNWYDPPTPYGFEFQALDDTLFTEIADFPIGDDDSFTVSVGDMVLGDFSPGHRVDFVSLFGQGISNFTITGIDSPFGNTAETAFPIRLGFDNDTGSFKMRPFNIPQDNPKPIPEAGSVLSLLVLGLWGLSGIGKHH